MVLIRSVIVVPQAFVDGLDASSQAGGKIAVLQPGVLIGVCERTLFNLSLSNYDSKAESFPGATPADIEEADIQVLASIAEEACDGADEAIWWANVVRVEGQPKLYAVILDRGPVTILSPAQAQMLEELSRVAGVPTNAVEK